MTNNDFILAFCIVFTGFGFVVAVGSILFSFQTQIRIGALEKSTHNVQFVPVDDMPGRDDDDDADIHKKIRRSEEDAMDGLRDDVDDLLHQGGTTPL